MLHTVPGSRVAPISVAMAATMMACASVAHAGGEPTLIAKTGDAAPAPLAGTIVSIGAPSVSVSHAMARELFTGDDQALVRRGPFGGGFETVVRVGDPLPGVNGAYLSFLFFLSDLNVSAPIAPINARGDLAFWAIVENPDTPNFSFRETLGAYWSAFGGETRQVWRRPDPLEDDEDMEFVNGGTPPLVTDDGAYVGGVFTGNDFNSPIPIRSDELGTRIITGGVERNRHGDGVSAGFDGEGMSQVFVTTASGQTTPLLEVSDPQNPGVTLIFTGLGIADDRTVAFTARPPATASNARSTRPPSKNSATCSRSISSAR